MSEQNADFFEHIKKSIFRGEKTAKKQGYKQRKNPKKRNSKQTLKTSIRRFILQIFRLTEQKNAEFVLQNRKTFVTLLREFYFFGDENKLYFLTLQE